MLVLLWILFGILLWSLRIFYIFSVYVRTAVAVGIPCFLLWDYGSVDYSTE